MQRSHLNILEYITEHPNARREDIRRGAAQGSSDTTLWRALKRLVEAGKIEAWEKAVQLVMQSRVHRWFSAVSSRSSSLAMSFGTGKPSASKPAIFSRSSSCSSSVLEVDTTDLPINTHRGLRHNVYDPMPHAGFSARNARDRL